MLPKTRKQFHDRCMRNLGEDVIEIELSEDQIQDKITEALEFYWDYHSDGTEKIFFKHKITQEDIDREYIEVPENIIGLSDVFPINSATFSNPLFGVKYQIMMNDFFNISSANIVPYNNTMVYMNMISDFFSTKPGIRYNRNQNKLFLDLDWKVDLTIGTYIIAEGYGLLDPDEFTDVWGDRWLIRYCTALLKQQWGANLKKINLMLPGGVTMNGNDVYMEATQELEKIESEVINSFSVPVGPFIG